jgi:rSAM/selenodomain-associated transferase 2
MEPLLDPTLPGLSVIIPTLDEGHQIGSTLDALARMAGHFEVIVVDGGSRDQTAGIARSRGVAVITAERGRGSQMHAGARIARGQVLWFLHADTIPRDDALRGIAEALADPDVVGGNFDLILSGSGWPARFLTWLYPRLRWLGLAYGDSAFFVRRRAYERVGGFRPYPIFEDLDLLRRLKRHGRFVHVPIPVITSSRNFEGRPFIPVFGRWVVLQMLFWLGISPVWLSRYNPSLRRSVRPASSGRKEASR